MTEEGVSTCGPYTIISTLGSGGNGVVKLAEKNGDQYALKIVSLDTRHNEILIKRTKEEFDIVKNLNMTNLMKYHEFNESATYINSEGEKKKVCYLAMEIVKGVELIEFISECEDLDDSTIRYIFKKVATAINLLHKAGIAHRDVKLENIMITEDFDIKLIDLGYAIALEGRTGSSFLKSRLGTNMYLAPEIIDKTLQYQGQDVDCFALGVSLLVSKIREYPWKTPNIDTDDNYNMLVHNHGTESDAFWSIFEEENTIDTKLKDLLEMMLAYDPTSRPTMVDILGHEWMRGETDSKEMFKQKCEAFMDAAITEKKQKNEELGTDFIVNKVR